MILNLRTVITAVCLMTIGAAPAIAQNAPRMDVAAGYQLLHVGTADGLLDSLVVPDGAYPAGWNLDGAWRLNDRISIVGEVGRSAKSNGGLLAGLLEDGDVDLDFKSSLMQFGAGPRWTRRSRGSISPFVQVLVGAAHHTLSMGAFGFDLQFSSTKAMVQPGGGVAVRINDQFGFVGQVDYRRVFVGDSTFTELQGEDDDVEVDLEDMHFGFGKNQMRMFFGITMAIR